MKHPICMIIPAAGMSRRHPPNKLLYRLENHWTVIETTVAAFRETPADIIVVVGYQKSLIQPLLEQRFGRRIRILRNPRFRSGMASSLRTALENLPGYTGYIGITNGDKPFIKPATIRHLMAALIAGKPLILAPEFEGQIGHPVFFAKSLQADLAALTGDTGGRSLLHKHLEDATLIPVTDRGVIIDMDDYLGDRYI